MLAGAIITSRNPEGVERVQLFLTNTERGPALKLAGSIIYWMAEIADPEWITKAALINMDGKVVDYVAWDYDTEELEALTGQDPYRLFA